MNGLKVAVSEESGELESSLNVLGFLDGQTSSLDFHRHSEDVLSAGRDDVLDLQRKGKMF